MMLSVKNCCLVLLMVVAPAVHAETNCSSIRYQQIVNTPKIPELRATTVGEVIALGGEMRQFIKRQEALLARCESAMEAAQYNRHVLTLRRSADKYNELVAFYQKTLADMRGMYEPSVIQSL